MACFAGHLAAVRKSGRDLSLKAGAGQDYQQADHFATHMVGSEVLAVTLLKRRTIPGRGARAIIREALNGPCDISHITIERG
jgi:hypothetical protein